MPIYEYQCEGCGEVFELIQKFSDPPLTVHEKCGGHVHRLLSAPAFQFKGSGWYVTDYAKGGNGSNQPEKKSAGEKKISSDASAGTESKPSSSESKGDSGTKPKSD